MRKSCWARSLAAVVFVGALFFGFAEAEAVQLEHGTVIDSDHIVIIVNEVEEFYCLGSVEVGQDIPEIVPATVDFMPGADVEGLITVGHSGTVNMYGGDYLSTWGTDFESWPEMTGVSDSSITFYGTNFCIGGVEVTDGLEADGIESVSLSSYTAGTYGGYGVSWDDLDGNSYLIWISAVDPINFVWLGAPQPEPDIYIHDLSLDFGDIPIGDTSTYVVQINNYGTADLMVSVSLEDSPGFTMTGGSPLDFVIAPGQISDEIVEITFAPLAAGLVSTSVTITSNDADEGTIIVTLTGKGTVEEDPIEEQIQAILDFYDASAGSTLIGDGPGNSAEKRLKALRNMIEAAGDLINLGEYELAAKQLRSVAKKTDGERRPPDFVVGDSVAELNTMVNELIADLTL